MKPTPRETGAARRERFEAVYRRQHAAVLAYVLRRVQDPHDAADALAETFLIAWRRFDDLPPGDDARLWLYGVARRVLANQRRGERRRLALGTRIETELAAYANDQPPPAGSGDPGDERLRAALQRLAPADRELLTLHAWEELDPGQIAAVLGCSRNAVRIRLHRARRRLTALAATDTDAGTEPALAPHTSLVPTSRS